MIFLLWISSFVFRNLNFKIRNISNSKPRNTEYEIRKTFYLGTLTALMISAMMLSRDVP